ncbi:esterase [Aureococcus anophagefferens]|nr:esterase [Aureococcus anophagefferens]
MLGRPRTKDDEYVCYESCKVTPRGCDERRGCDSASCMADSAFVTALLAKLKGELCVDLGAVHLAGISAGGMMAYQAALDNHAQIASVAPVAGSRFVGFNEAPASPVAVLSSHGYADWTIPANASNGEPGPKPGPTPTPA